MDLHAAGVLHLVMSSERVDIFAAPQTLTASVLEEATYHYVLVIADVVYFFSDSVPRDHVSVLVGSRLCRPLEHASALVAGLAQGDSRHLAHLCVARAHHAARTALRHVDHSSHRTVGARARGALDSWARSMETARAANNVALCVALRGAVTRKHLGRAHVG